MHLDPLPYAHDDMVVRVPRAPHALRVGAALERLVGWWTRAHRLRQTIEYRLGD